jgi:hypothetical protein
MQLIHLLAVQPQTDTPSLFVAGLFIVGFIVSLIAPGLKKQRKYPRRKELSNQHQSFH